jgi:hypothetical protein
MVRVDDDRRDVELVEFLLVALRMHEPTVRPHLVEAARARLEAGAWPAAVDVADTVVAEFA